MIGIIKFDSKLGMNDKEDIILSAIVWAFILTLGFVFARWVGRFIN